MAARKIIHVDMDAFYARSNSGTIPSCAASRWWLPVKLKTSDFKILTSSQTPSIPPSRSCSSCVAGLGKLIVKLLKYMEPTSGLEPLTCRLRILGNGVTARRISGLCRCPVLQLHLM